MHDHRVMFDLPHVVFAKPQRLPVGTTRLIEQSKVVGIKDSALGVCMVELHPRVIPKTFRRRHAFLPHLSVSTSGHHRDSSARMQAERHLELLLLRASRASSTLRRRGYVHGNGYGGVLMHFEEILDQAIAMLQRRGRITYRALKRQFNLDDAFLEDLTVELIKGQRLARD